MHPGKCIAALSACVAASAGKSLDMALTTLRKMAAGGVHDHVGGGFHRYSVDEFWHIPHFEKMMCAPCATSFNPARQYDGRHAWSTASEPLDTLRRQPVQSLPVRSCKTSAAGVSPLAYCVAPCLLLISLRQACPTIRSIRVNGAGDASVRTVETKVVGGSSDGAHAVQV